VGGTKMMVAVCLLGLGVLLMGAAPQDPEEQVREIAAQLRCPVCQNLSVGDSPSELANQMRGVIRDRLRAGQTREQIEAYFVEKYGEWVLLAPTKQGFNLLAWVLPFVGVAAGGVVVVMLVHRWSARQAAGAGETGPAEAGPKPEEAAYRERLRRELEDFSR
jgi:cytochrome c-type biogenesis protein CcmH